LGTRCLWTILLEAISVPASLYHIHNLAMRNMVISVTNLKEKKKDLKELVLFMGADFTESLTDAVTHLVSETVLSVKYESAALNNVKIMHPDWVKNVWQKTQNNIANVCASDEQFDSFKLPALYGICITTIGMKIADRNHIKTLTEENGGRYSRKFNNSIDFLIMEKESLGSENHKAAVKFKVMCLTPAWIHDSIENGFAMPFGVYELSNPGGAMLASTPTKNANITVSKFHPDNTQLSEVSRSTTFQKNVINETLMSSTSRRTLAPVAEDVAYRKLLRQVTLPAAKKVGSILDGYNFYLSGFTDDEAAALGKILAVLGSSVVDSISGQVSHVIVGADDARLFNELDEHNLDLALLKLEWIVEVIASKSVVPEAQYEIARPNKKKPLQAKPSPASKKALKSLSGTFKRPEIPKLQLEPKKIVEDEAEMDLVNQYLEPPSVLESSDY
jgi:hypothetical protein